MPPTYPYRATALMKYKSAPGGPAFSFGAGDELRVLAAADEEGDWLEGENARGAKGVFPSSFVRELEEQEEGRGDSASVEAVGTAQNEEAEQKARETVEATPKDDTNVVEGSESTPADEPALAAEPTSPPAPPKVDAPPETITSPTVADVTPSATVAAEAPAKSASPPPPAKKPNALASRIAAFNAAAQQQAPPPVAPKPKPRQWARPAAPAAAPPPPAAPSSDAPPAPAPPAAPSDLASAASATDETQPQAQRDFSAEDAQESISRGGGSLRDRIKALQGGLKMEQPPAPGRAPPKPWRKPSAEPDAAEEAKEEGKKTQQDEAEVLQDAVVKDERPREDETNAQSPGAEVPGFDPAEGESPFVPGSIAGDDEQEANSQDAIEPASSSSNAAKQESAAASVAAPAIVEEKEQDSTVSSVAVPIEPEEVKPVQDESAALGDEDDEESKRASLAARMANLGGQRMGLPMPALPKRAAGPRARKAKAAVSPAAVEVEEKALGEKDKPVEEAASTDEPVAPAGTDDAEASVVQPSPEEQKEQEGDVLASMGGANALLAQDDEDEETTAKAPIDDDDFDSPAPPAPPQRTIPPSTDESEPAVEGDEPSARAPPPPPLSSRPPLPPSFAREEADESTGDLPDSGATARSPPPPSRPLDPPASSSGAEPIADEPQPTAHEAERDQADDAHMSPPPLPKGRPPVPPAFVRQGTEQPAAAEQDKEEEETASKDAEEPQHPPLPTHPAPLGEKRVTTAAEDAFIAQMPEIVTPPEEAADESTAAPSLNAPTTETIAQGRIEDGHEPADMGQPAWGKVEGTETPAVELSPPALAPKMMSKEDTNAAPAEPKQEEEDEEEEEDPEIARRRALAARMAKLGGRGPLMGGPMLGFGGLPPKKPAKKKPTSELAEQGDLNAAGGPKPDRACGRQLLRLHSRLTRLVALQSPHPATRKNQLPHLLPVVQAASPPVASRSPASHLSVFHPNTSPRSNLHRRKKSLSRSRRRARRSLRSRLLRRMRFSRGRTRRGRKWRMQGLRRRMRRTRRRSRSSSRRRCRRLFRPAGRRLCRLVGRCRSRRRRGSSRGTMRQTMSLSSLTSSANRGRSKSLKRMARNCRLRRLKRSCRLRHLLLVPQAATSLPCPSRLPCRLFAPSPPLRQLIQPRTRHSSSKTTPSSLAPLRSPRGSRRSTRLARQLTFRSSLCVRPRHRPRKRSTLRPRSPTSTTSSNGPPRSVRKCSPPHTPR